MDDINSKIINEVVKEYKILDNKVVSTQNKNVMSNIDDNTKNILENIFNDIQSIFSDSKFIIVIITAVLLGSLYKKYN